MDAVRTSTSLPQAPSFTLGGHLAVVYVDAETGEVWPDALRGLRAGAILQSFITAGRDFQSIAGPSFEN
jgi:hypothetical protein